MKCISVPRECKNAPNVRKGQKSGKSRTWMNQNIRISEYQIIEKIGKSKPEILLSSKGKKRTGRTGQGRAEVS